MAFTHAVAINKYGNSKLIVATDAAYGTHTTLASAMADAVSGDTIFLRDSVTENVTITPGVNIACWNGSTLNVPSITGTLTMTGAGTSLLSGLRLVTNGAALIAVTGSAASILRVENCFLSMATTAISHTSSDSGSTITLRNCNGDVTTTGVAIFSDSSTGPLRIFYCSFTNTGSSVTQNTKSAGQLQIFFSNFNAPITYSSSNTTSSIIKSGVGNGDNVIALTTSGTGSMSILNTNFTSGNTSSISIGSGTTLAVNNCSINSSNTNAIDGAGTITYSQLMYVGSSSKNNVTTQTGGIATGIIKTTGPSAGFIGEQLRGTLGSGSAISLTNTTSANIVTLSLTAGVWDVSCIGCFGGAPTGYTAGVVAISETSATSGTLGDNALSLPTAPTAASNACLSIPSFRIYKASTSNVYLVLTGFFTGGTLNGFGRISATRVG